jgi:DNA-directed RNA polymerase specialized sigma subunit
MPLRKDFELWQKWNRTRSPLDFDALLKQMMPLIKTEVQKHVGVLDYMTLESEAILQAKKAFETYNPTAGASLATHLVNYLKKMKRMIYEKQSFLKVPEAHKLRWNTFNIARQDLMNQLGREPSFAEMKDRLGWSTQALTLFNRYMDKAEFSEDKPMPKFLAIDLAMTDSEDKKLLAYLYHDLNPQEQRLFELLTGYGGITPARNATEIMRKLGINQNQLSYQKKKLIEKIEELSK